MTSPRIVEFDIDGTLTTSAGIESRDKVGSYVYRRPNERMCALVRHAYAAGWTVVIHTGRREEQRRVTESWLAQHDVPYHFLLMGKPPCTYRIDDVNIAANEFEALIGPLSTTDEWQK